MSHITSRKLGDSSGQDDATTEPKKGGKQPAGKRGHKLLFVIILFVIIGAVFIGAAFANTSVRGLEIQKGDNLQYSIQGYESNRNVTGALMVEATSVSSNSVTVTYTITLNKNTTRTDVTFSGASGDWSSNIGNIIGRLSGSSAPATVSNTTTYNTITGEKDLTGYVISTTTQSGVSVFYEYWLDSTTNCPYTMGMTYGNGDTLTFNLVYTNIAKFN